LLLNSQREFDLALRNQKVAHRRLAALLNVEETEGVIAADNIQIYSAWDKPLEESILMAYQNRPELNQLIALREVNNQQRRGALANLMPSLTLRGGIGSAAFALPDFDFDLDLTDPDEAIVLDFSWNPFDIGGGIRARATAERRELEADEANFAGCRRDVRNQVEEAFYELETAANNINREMRLESRALNILELARTGAGQAGQLDLLEAQTDYTDTRLTFISTVMDYNRASAILELAIGGLGLFPALPTEFPNEDYQLFDVTPPDAESSKKQEEIPATQVSSKGQDSTKDKAGIINGEGITRTKQFSILETLRFDDFEVCPLFQPTLQNL
ncbi:MAG: TolC family protein, partial [Cyanobacteria bacterium J06642_11]